MSNSARLIPASKRDWEAVRNLQAASPAQLIALADELLPWLQDMNWPIADDIQALLVPHVPAISDTIVRILNESDDDVWKMWLITALLTEIPAAQLSDSLREALWRIVRQPTAGESDYVVDIARYVLEIES